jgi:hypothetical protein
MLSRIEFPGLMQGWSSLEAQPNRRRRAHNSRGFKIPIGVMMPVINSAGVTSKPGFNAPLVGLATRT